jgi:hypothetical protein
MVRPWNRHVSCCGAVESPVTFPLLVSRTSTSEEAAEQAGIKVRSRGGTPAGEVAAKALAARREAAALHYLRTGELVMDKGELDVAAVTAMLRLEEAGAAPCGDCVQCLDGGSCKRAQTREACRRGRRGARWANEAELLVGRRFRVRTQDAPLAVGVLRGIACAVHSLACAD